METKESLVTVLSRVPALAQLHPDVLGGIAGAALVRTYARGEEIVKQGSIVPCLLVVAEGGLKVSITSPNGHHMILELLRSGDAFGLDLCLSGGPAPVAIEAIGSTRLLIIDRASLEQLVSFYPEFAQAALAMMAETVGRRTGQVSDFVFLELHQRIAKLLLGMLDSTQSGGDQQTITMRLPLGELAGVVGGQPEAVREVMLTFQQLGYIQLMGGHTIMIRKPQVLREQVASGGSWAQLTKSAFHDTLTGLPNRAYFYRTASNAVVAARSTGGAGAVLFIDLDGFKQVNDKLGHAAGDNLLVQVGERLRRSIRPTDTPSRFGGDEFGALLENMQSVQDASLVAGRIVEALGAPFTIPEGVVTVGASVGVAVFHGEPDLNFEEVLANADKAMYAAKNLGKGRYVVYGADVLA